MIRYIISVIVVVFYANTEPVLLPLTVTDEVIVVAVMVVNSGRFCSIIRGKYILVIVVAFGVSNIAATITTIIICGIVAVVVSVVIVVV